MTEHALTDQCLTDQCCRTDERQNYIKDIIKNIDYIQKELDSIKNSIDNSKTEGDAVEKIRTFEGIAKTRYHANNIASSGQWLDRLTVLLEREIIEIEGQ